MLFRCDYRGVVIIGKQCRVADVIKELALLIDYIVHRSTLKKITGNKNIHVTKNHITKIEAETIQLLSLGYSVAQVSDILDKSVKTVSVQKSNALRKMGLKNRVHSLSYISSGLVEGTW